MIKKSLTIEGVTFDVAPTPLVKLLKGRQHMASGQGGTPEAMEALVEAIFWGARRAGSKITLEWLLENVDQHNMAEVLAVFRELNVSEALPAIAAAPEGST